MSIEMLAQIDEVTGSTYFAVNINGQDYRVSAADLLEYAQNGLTFPSLEFASVSYVSVTSRSSVITDNGLYLRFIATSAKAYTVEPQISTAWPENAEIHGRNAAASDLTLTAGVGVTLNAPYLGTLVVPTGGSFTIKRVAADEWDIIGQTVPA